MPSVDEIRTITIQAVSDGVEKATADINALVAAQGDLAVVSDTSTRAQTSVASALERQQTSLDVVYRSQKTFNQSQLAITTGFNEGLISVDRYNQLMQLAGQRFEDATKKTTPFEQGVDKIKDKASDLSRELGPLGSVLSAIGPWGLAAAAGIGLLAVAYEEASRTAHLLSAEAVNLEKFSETTGLSTDTLQALTLAAAKHGVAAEDATSAIVRFTSAWAEAREGGGTFLTQLQKINPGLADQVQRTKDSATAFDILTQAIRQADAAGDIAQRNALLRAAGGRGGVSALTGVSAAVGDAGGLSNLTKEAVDAGEAINGKLLKEVQQLQVQIDETKKHADLLFGTIGAESILKSELAWQKMRERIAETAVEMTKAEEHKPFWQWFFDKLAATSESGVGFVAAVNAAAAGLNQPSLNQLPAYPPALNTVGLEGPSPAAPQKDIKAQLSDLKEQITLLGSAATANERLQLRLMEIKAAVEGNATAENKLAAARGASAAQLDAEIASQSAYNTALGASAPISEIVNAKYQQLQRLQLQNPKITDDQIAQQKALTAAQALGTYQIQSQIDSEKVKQATIGMSVGDAAAYTAEQTRLNKAIQDEQTLTPKELADLHAKTQALGQVTQATAQQTAQSRASFDLQTVFLSDTEKQIAAVQQQLHQNAWPQYMNDGLSATLRVTASLKQLNDIAGTAASSIFKNISEGVAPMKAFADAAKAAAESVVDIATKKIASNLLGGLLGDTASMTTGATTSAAILTTAGTTLAASIVAGATEAAAILGLTIPPAAATLPIAGAATGTEVAAGGVAAGASLATGGAVAGAALWGPIAALAAAVAAIGALTFESGNSSKDDALKQAQLDWQKMTIDVTNFSLAAKGVNLGPLTQEVQSLLSTYTQLQAAALKAHDQAGADQSSIDFGNAVNRLVAQFKEGEQTLTPYAQAMKSLNDEAEGLEDTLISLKDYTLANEVGISLQKQLDALAQQFVTSFTQGLQARINTANGNDYLNSIASTISQHQSDILEAQQLGISQSLVDQTFDAEIQKIVNDAGLVGDSFNDFIKQFPQFAGVVTESSTALQAANDKFVQLTKTISDYLNSLSLGSNSTLSPQQQLQLAQSNFQQQFALAQGGDQTALGSITQSADAYLNQAKSFYASSSGYSDVYAAVTNALQSLIGGQSSGLGAPIGPSPLFSSTAVSSAVPGVVMPQVSSAANDNSTSQYFQTQTTALSQVFTQVGQAQIVALQSGVADLGKRLDRIANAVEAKGKAARPLQKAAGG